MAVQTPILYPSFKKTGHDGTFDLDNCTLRFHLLTSGYTYSSAHDELADVSAFVVTTTGYNGPVSKVLTAANWESVNDTRYLNILSTAVFTATNPLTAKYVVCYLSTGANPLMFCCDLQGSGSVLTATAPGQFVVSFPGNRMLLFP